MSETSKQVSDKSEGNSLGIEDKEMINATLESLYEKLTEVNKYPLKSHLASIYLDRNGNHIHFDENFYIGGTDEENCDVEGYFFAEKDRKTDPYRMSLTVKNPKYFKDGDDYFPFAFPKRMMGNNGHRREKLCAWMVKEIFKTFDADELEFFVDNESVFEERIRFIDWETIFENDPNLEKIGNGCFATRDPKEKTEESKPSLRLVADNA